MVPLLLVLDVEPKMLLIATVVLDIVEPGDYFEVALKFAVDVMAVVPGCLSAAVLAFDLRSLMVVSVYLEKRFVV